MKRLLTAKSLLILVLIVLTLTIACSKKKVSSDAKGVDILFLMSKNYGLNNFLMWDVFDQYGWNVTTMGVLDTVTACPWTIEYWNVPPAIPDLLQVGF